MKHHAFLLLFASLAALAGPPAPTLAHLVPPKSSASGWSGLLDVVIGDELRLDAGSSQPKGDVSRVRTGSPGDLADPTGTFLIFDGPRARLRLQVPAWRRVDAFAFYALEARSRSRAVARVWFERAGKPRAQLEIAREVVSSRAGMAQVRYRTSAAQLGLGGGDLVIEYDNRDFGSAFISEVRVDDLGAPDGLPPLRCAGCPPRLLWWQQARVPEGLRLYSMLVRVESSGDARSDVAPAWLALPADSSGPLPLVVAAHARVPLGALELLGMAGRPELAFAPGLARAGFAVLVVELDERATAAQSLARLRAVLREATQGASAANTHVSFDAQRFAALGLGDAAALARDLAADDPRFERLAGVGARATQCRDGLPGIEAMVQALKGAADATPAACPQASARAHDAEFEAAAAAASGR